MQKLSVTVITRNEAANIAAALESVSWADEIVVVDSESTDDTVAIARRFTSRVVVRPWSGYIEQKNHAASLAAKRRAVIGALVVDHRAIEPPRTRGQR